MRIQKCISFCRGDLSHWQDWNLRVRFCHPVNFGDWPYVGYHVTGEVFSGSTQNAYLGQHPASLSNSPSVQKSMKKGKYIYNLIPRDKISFIYFFFRDKFLIGKPYPTLNHLLKGMNIRPSFPPSIFPSIRIPLPPCSRKTLLSQTLVTTVSLLGRYHVTWMLLTEPLPHTTYHAEHFTHLISVKVLCKPSSTTPDSVWMYCEFLICTDGNFTF